MPGTSFSTALMAAGFSSRRVNGVTVRNSDFGPCDSSGPRWCDRIFIQDTRGTDPAPTQNILFENNKVHDYKQVTAADHWECMFTTGGTNVTIRRNHFCSCDLYAIATGARANSDYVNWIIENNWFGRSGDVVNGQRASAINLSGPPGFPVNDTLIRFNSFAPGQTVVREGPDLTRHSHYRKHSGKQLRLRSRSYLRLQPAPQRGRMQLNRPGALLVALHESFRLERWQHHLVPGSVAEGFVTSTSSDTSLAVDKDGDARSAPRDAGADER